MKTLVVYYSFSGNNRQLARAIQERTDCDLLEIIETRKRTGFRIMMDIVFRRKPRIKPVNLSWEEYDQVILSSPIWNLHIAHPMQTFLKRYSDRFDRFSFITLCVDRDGQQESLRDQLIAMTGRLPEQIKQLKIDDLDPFADEDKAQHVVGYRVSRQEINSFGHQIDKFLESVAAEPAVA